MLSCNYSEQPKQIILQPLGDVPKKQVSFILSQLLEIDSNVILRDKIDLPKSAFYEPRNRYRADSIIDYLKKIKPDNTVTIAITNKDISHTNGKIKDYGIMGLGFCPGNACVISSYRLSKKKINEQFFKVVIHELGHTQGLPHCGVFTCFMRDAKGKNITDEVTEFCPSCKEHLTKKGLVIQ
jgi:archaemetzincin